ncbi:hypothetical protein O988_01753 [Pseudogymnoascus sp. VKM F-3808]|nr:hypothetical protein O988_01753 [Pseudogymnoascus sp. VKM F-3808]
MILSRKDLDSPDTLSASLTSNNNQTYNQINQYQLQNPTKTPTKPPNQTSWVTVDAPALLPATAETAALAPRAENKFPLAAQPPHSDLTHFTPYGTYAMGRFDNNGWNCM